MKLRTTCCAAVGCQHTIREPLLMCVEHWRMVPAATRRAVQSTWRRALNEPEARQQHLKAVREAIDAVRQKCEARQERAAQGTPALF